MEFCFTLWNSQWSYRAYWGFLKFLKGLLDFADLGLGQTTQGLFVWRSIVFLSFDPVVVICSVILNIRVDFYLSSIISVFGVLEVEKWTYVMLGVYSDTLDYVYWGILDFLRRLLGIGDMG